MKAIDTKKLDQVKAHAADVKSTYAQRNAFYKQVDDAYLLRWGGGGKPSESGAMLVQSPDLRNAALGAVRLMVATDPIVKIANIGLDEDKSGKIEKAGSRFWDMAGRVAGNPLHYDMILSSLLYGEIHTAITQTADLVKHAEKAGKGVARAKAIAARTPFLVKVWNPSAGYPEYDSLGLCSYYRVVKTTPAKLITDYGDMVPDKMRQGDLYKEVEVHQYYDLDVSAVWTDAGPIMLEEHGLPYLPIVATETEGSSLWSKPEEARQPLLYSAIKAGLWDYQNMALSVMATVVKQMGITPLFTHTAPTDDPNKRLEINFDDVPGVVELVQGEQFMPMVNKGLIDPAVADVTALIQGKVQESTIFPQALGAPVASGTAFSTLSLLSQSGRLPLTSTQRRGGFGIADVMEKMFAFLKSGGGKLADYGLDLELSDIPDTLLIDVALDVKLPQDKLQQANIAAILTSGDNPLTSQAWARENVLNIGQSGEMDKAIWTEKAKALMVAKYLQDMMQPQQPPTPPTPQGGMPGGPGGMMPPELAGMNAGAAMPPGQGEMIQGGLPPQMGGMLPGQGEAAMPPEMM